MNRSTGSTTVMPDKGSPYGDGRRGSTPPGSNLVVGSARERLWAHDSRHRSQLVTDAGLSRVARAEARPEGDMLDGAVAGDLGPRSSSTWTVRSMRSSSSEGSPGWSKQ